MLTSGDLTRMRSDLAAIISDNDVDIVVRRGATTLDAQTVRIARTGSGSKTDSPGGQESKGKIIVVGDTGFDIKVDDRFTDNGILYRVVFVRPHRLIGVFAEAEAVQ